MTVELLPLVTVSRLRRMVSAMDVPCDGVFGSNAAVPAMEICFNMNASRSAPMDWIAVSINPTTTRPESPAGFGFGRAALDTAKSFEFRNTFKRRVLLTWQFEFVP